MPGSMISIKMYHLWVFLGGGSASGWELWDPRGHRFEPVGGWSHCRRHPIPSGSAFYQFLQEGWQVCCCSPPMPAKKVIQGWHHHHHIFSFILMRLDRILIEDKQQKQWFLMHHTFLCLQVIALLAYNLYQPVLKNEFEGKIVKWWILHFDEFFKKWDDSCYVLACVLPLEIQREMSRLQKKSDEVSWQWWKGGISFMIGQQKRGWLHTCNGNSQMETGK